MPPSAVYSSLADSSRWCIHKSILGCQHGLSSKTRTASQGDKSQLQSPLSLLKNRQPNLAFISGRPTSSSDLALSRSSSVQRLFFCGDVIAITSWAQDVVNLVRPVLKRHSRSSYFSQASLSSPFSPIVKLCSF